MVLFEAAPRLGGQILLAAQGWWRGDLIGIVDWRAAELERLVRQDCGSCHGMTLKGGLGSDLRADALMGKDPGVLAEIILDGLDMKPLQQVEPTLKCQCSEDRLFRAVRLLPREEVEDILEKEEQVEARCQFCGKVYRFPGPELRERLDKLADEDASRD